MPMLMAPKPMAETRGPRRPSWRVSIALSLPQTLGFDVVRAPLNDRRSRSRTASQPCRPEGALRLGGGPAGQLGRPDLEPRIRLQPEDGPHLAPALPVEQRDRVPRRVRGKQGRPVLRSPDRAPASGDQAVALIQSRLVDRS